MTAIFGKQKYPDLFGKPTKKHFIYQRNSDFFGKKN